MHDLFRELAPEFAAELREYGHIYMYRYVQFLYIVQCTEPEFLNFYGAQESIPRNQFRQSVKPGGPVRQPHSYSVPSPH
jgi:hypothetical protein